jgi:hypothetical protein
LATDSVEPGRPADEIRVSINEKMDYLMRSNAEVVYLLRGRANLMNELAEKFIDQAHYAATVAGELAELALSTSTVTGDLLIAEFGSEVSPEECEDDPEDED